MMRGSTEESIRAVLSEMAQVQVWSTQNRHQIEGVGLCIALPQRSAEAWTLDDEQAIDFFELPESFARTYLQVQLRDFLYESFCEPAIETSVAADAQILANDRVSGGLHTALLEQFQQSNCGQGYFDAGWRVVSPEQNGALSVEKYGVVLSVERSRHLLPTQSPTAPNQHVSIRLPCYRFEPGYYIAIGDRGSVTEPATEIYFAASALALPSLLKTLTTALNQEIAMPFTLRAPYEPEEYRGAEAIALRITKSSLAQIKPLLKRIRAAHTPEQIRTDAPLFGHSLFPGISTADVIESNSTDWFGSSADFSRLELVAAALADHWMQKLHDPGTFSALGESEPEKAKAETTGASASERAILSSIQQRFEQAGLCWQQPYLHHPHMAS